MRWGAGWRWCSCRATWSSPRARRRVRRQYLDRLLSLADRGYLRALTRYRAALAQRNSALRQGRPSWPGRSTARWPAAGAEIVAARERWARRRPGADSPPSSIASASASRADLSYRGAPELADPGAWVQALERGADRPTGPAAPRRSVPHRDDLQAGDRGTIDPRVRLHRPAAQRRGGAQAAGDGDAARGARHRAGAPARRRLRRAGRRAPAAARGALDRHRRIARCFSRRPGAEELPRGLGLEVWSVTGRPGGGAGALA